MLNLSGSVSAGGLALNLGSDATGDLYYRNSSGNFARLPLGTDGQALEVSSGLPAWETISGGGNALTSNPLSQFASTTSSQLAGVISDETGTGALVFANSPTFITPSLGVASASSGTVIGSQTFTTNNIADSGALTIASGGTNGLTLKTPAQSAGVTNSGGITIDTGTASGSASNSGSISIDSGSATGSAGAISIGGTHTTSINIGNSNTSTSLTLTKGSSGNIKLSNFTFNDTSPY